MRFLIFSFFHKFHKWNPPGPVNNGFKKCQFCLRACWVIKIVFTKVWLPGYQTDGQTPGVRKICQNMTLQGLLPLRVSLPRFWYPGQSISPGSDTPASQSPRGLIPRPVNLPGVWYPGQSIWCPGQSISPGSDTLASQSPQGLIRGQSINRYNF